MYRKFIKSEIGKIRHDSMMLFMFFAPLLFGLMGRYLIPGLAEVNDFDIILIADYVLVGLAIMMPLLYGALVGFSILDDRDDNILMTIKVSPLSIHQYLSFRLIMATILSFLAVIFILWFSDIVVFALTDLLLIAFLASLSAPAIALFINVIAKNKIEGFAIMKGVQIVLLVPLISLYFTDYKELFFSIVPGYWPTKVISIVVKGEGFSYLTYNVYYIIGFVYIVLLNIVIYHLFLKRS